MVHGADFPRLVHGQRPIPGHPHAGQQHLLQILIHRLYQYPIHTFSAPGASRSNNNCCCGGLHGARRLLAALFPVSTRRAQPYYSRRYGHKRLCTRLRILYRQLPALPDDLSRFHADHDGRGNNRGPDLLFLDDQHHMEQHQFPSIYGRSAANVVCHHSVEQRGADTGIQWITVHIWRTDVLGL